MELDKGLNIIHGPNERGKSSILKGISSILFGINKSDRSVFRRKAVLEENMEDFSGEIVLDVDNVPITIKRNFDSDSVKIYQKEELIFSGDISRGSRSTERQYYNDLLKKYIGVASPSVFNHAFFLEQGQMDHLFTDEDITTIKDIIPQKSELKYSEVLDNILEEYHEITKTPPDYIGGRSMNKDRKIELAQKRKEKLESVLFDNEQKFKKLQELHAKLKNMQAEKNRFETMVETFHLQADELENKIKAAEKIEHLLQELKLVEAKYEQVTELEKQMASVQDEILEEEAGFSKGFIAETVIGGVIAGFCISLFFILPSLFIIWSSVLAITILSYAFICYNNYKEKRRKEKHNAKLVLEQQRLSDLIASFAGIKGLNIRIDELDMQLKELRSITEGKTEANFRLELENVKKQNKNNESMILSITREIAEISGRISTLEGEVESLSSLTDDIEDVKREISELDHKKTVLGFSAMYLSKSIESYISKYVERIAEVCSEMLSYVSSDRYRSFKIDSNLVFELKTSSGLGFNNKNLSYGTKDLSWFALRFALARMLMGDAKLPLFLDDPFVHIDEERRLGIFEYLVKQSDKISQLVFFTHDPWYIEQDWQSFGKFNRRSL